MAARVVKSLMSDSLALLSCLHWHCRELGAQGAQHPTGTSL